MQELKHGRQCVDFEDDCCRNSDTKDLGSFQKKIEKKNLNSISELLTLKNESSFK